MDLGSWKVVQSIQTSCVSWRSTSLRSEQLTIKSFRLELVDVLHHVHLLEVDSDDLRTGSLGESETGGDSVDDVDFLGSLEDGESGGTLLAESAKVLARKRALQLDSLR